MKKFKIAGVAKMGDRFSLRASNRENFEKVLIRDKFTNIKLVKLNKPMTRDEIRETLARRKDFKSPAIQKVLAREVTASPRKAPAAKKKAAAKRKTATPKVEQSAVAA